MKWSFIIEDYDGIERYVGPEGQTLKDPRSYAFTGTREEAEKEGELRVQRWESQPTGSCKRLTVVATPLLPPPGWISIKDELPPLNLLCWMWNGQECWIGSRTEDSWTTSQGHIWWDHGQWDCETWPDTQPTHWQHLPTPPGNTSE